MMHNGNPFGSSPVRSAWADLPSPAATHGQSGVFMCDVDAGRGRLCLNPPGHVGRASCRPCVVVIVSRRGQLPLQSVQCVQTLGCS